MRFLKVSKDVFRFSLIKSIVRKTSLHPARKSSTTAPKLSFTVVYCHNGKLQNVSVLLVKCDFLLFALSIMDDNLTSSEAEGAVTTAQCFWEKIAMKSEEIWGFDDFVWILYVEKNGGTYWCNLECRGPLNKLWRDRFVPWALSSIHVLYVLYELN